MITVWNLRAELILIIDWAKQKQMQRAEPWQEQVIERLSKIVEKIEKDVENED